MVSEVDTYEEKRQVERKYLVFYLRVFEGMGQNVIGHVANISSKGVMLLSDMLIPVDKQYILRMRLPSATGDRNDISFEAVSRWSRKDSNPDFFLAGFEMNELQASEKQEILDLLEEFSFIEK